MNGDSASIVPNIPPAGLRAVEESCIVCARDVACASVRYPLRLQLSQKGDRLPALIVGYACDACHADRLPEVRAAQFLAAQRYLHVKQPERL